jgi:VIT1/CCC1 family predicted Fe2+/Mn2+ transporter
MIEIYTQKGLTLEDATVVIETLAKYKDVFVDVMLVDELGAYICNYSQLTAILGIQPPDTSTSPWKNGLVTFAAFAVFGSVPLLSFVIAHIAGSSSGGVQAEFIAACVLTACTLFLLGVLKSRLTGQHWISSGAIVLFTGGLAAIVSFLLGLVMKPLAA